MLPRLPLLRLATILLSAKLLTISSHAQSPQETDNNPSNNQANQPIEGSIEHVTLYQGTALISRSVQIPADQTGVFQVTVSPLPSATDPNSVFADNASGLSIRSAVCRERPYDQQERLDSRVGQLQEEIDQLRREIATNSNEIALRRIRQDYLRGLESFIGPAVDAEMSNGVIQAEEIEAVTQMHFREYEQASQEIMQLDFQNQDLRTQFERKSRERAQLAQGPPVQYDAILLIEKPQAGEASLHVNYLVTGCNWSPLYSLRGNPSQQSANLDFNAQITQVSGENWHNVHITLSTAEPRVEAFNPSLTPLRVSLSSQDTPQASSQQNAQLRRQSDRLLSARTRNSTIAEQAGNVYEANQIADRIQFNEMGNSVSEQPELGPTHSPSIEYKLDQLVSVNSQSSTQVVPVSTRSADAQFYHIAVPVLTESIFREALISNDSSSAILAGSVQVYLEGQFVGRTQIPTIARGRSFPIGFGVNPQLRVRRQLLDRTETFQGGNKKVDIATQISVDHFGDQAIQLQVRERLPWMANDNSLRVNLTDPGIALSTNAEYLATERDQGILLWETTVQPNNGEDVLSWVYNYTLEYDRNLNITSSQQGDMRLQFVQEQYNNSK